MEEIKKEKEKLKILLATSEAVPFAHTGGLGEVATALPKSLNARKDQDVDCRVILPLYGKIDGSFREQPRQAAAQAEGARYTILLTHRPEQPELYTLLGFDLVLAGHAHGGQWRIPGVLNGLYAPDQGLFPRYAGGRYELDGTVMIVSRGLARESTRVPRFYNRPELVMIELKP